MVDSLSESLYALLLCVYIYVCVHIYIYIYIYAHEHVVKIISMLFRG